MSNILQVTDPSTYIDNRNVHTGQEQQSALNSSQIQNPSDPSRVVRADGQKSGTAGDQENESGFSVRNYNGNYTDFLQKLGQENEIKDSLGRILFRDGAFIAKGDEDLGKMVQQLLDSARFEDSGQLLDFLKMQGQTKFSGTFFENLRTLLQQEGNRGLQETALKFLQVFNNYSSGEHLLEQMQELTDEIKGMLYTSARQEYASILDQLDWKAENGEPKENAQVLFQKLVPFLSKYISRTHDYGSVRSSVIQLILYGHVMKTEAVSFSGAFLNKWQLIGILNVFLKQSLKNCMLYLPVQKEKKEIFMEIFLAHLWKEGPKEKPGWNMYRIFIS